MPQGIYSFLQRNFSSPLPTICLAILTLRIRPKLLNKACSVEVYFFNNASTVVDDLGRKWMIWDIEMKLRDFENILTSFKDSFDIRNGFSNF